MSQLPESVANLAEPSEYLQEVLKTPPRWIIRWGEVLVFLLVITLLVLSWLIRYPDRIAAEVVITTPRPPVEIVARADGQLTHLLVNDHDTVVAGALLGVIQNTAYYPDVLSLQQQLVLLDSSELSASDSLFTQAYQLGSLQPYYALARQTWKEYTLYLQLTPHYQQQRAVEQQLKRVESLLVQKQRQQQLLERRVQLVQKDFRRNEQLHASKTIADKALEESERALLEVKEGYAALLSEVAQIRVQVAGLRRERQQFGVQHSQTGEQLRTALITTLKNLASQITLWEEQYVLKASQPGVVSFFDFWSEQQHVKTGQVVMRVISVAAKQPAIGRLRVPVLNFGKVAVGQSVRVYLDNYPHKEYGALQGIIRNLSDLPQEGYYSVAVAFPEGFTTQYGQAIPFQQQLSGRAEIVTEDLRLLERFLYELRAVWRARNPSWHSS